MHEDEKTWNFVLVFLNFAIFCYTYFFEEFLLWICQHEAELGRKNAKTSTEKEKWTSQLI